MAHFPAESSPNDNEKDELTRSVPPPKQKLPLKWQIAMVILTCMCTFGNHWSNGLIVAMKTTIEKNLKINNSKFATLVSITNLINTFLCILIGFAIDKFGGPTLSVFLAAFHLAGALVQAGATTNHVNSYTLLTIGKVLAAFGDGSLDNAQHKIFTTYFAPGNGFAFSIGLIRSMANLAQFVGQSTANIIAQNMHSYAWTLWISSIVSLVSLLCATSVMLLDKYLRAHYEVIDYSAHFDRPGARSAASMKTGTFHWPAVFEMPLTFWLVVFFAVFENAGVQSFVSISTQFAQQRLKKGAVVGGWVSSFYLLLPVGLTPFEGIFIDAHGHRVTFLFLSGVMFLVSMLLLRLSEDVPTFVCAYVFYALSQSLTPAPQVEIIRSIIPDPHYYATAFAVKKSIVQGSIVVIVTVAGKLQDLSPTSSLSGAVTVWVVYAFVSVLVSGVLFACCYTTQGKRWLPAARLAQVRPAKLESEVEVLWEARVAGTRGATGGASRLDMGSPRRMRVRSSGVDDAEVDVDTDADELTPRHKEIILKSPFLGGSSVRARIAAVVVGIGIVVIAWVLFGMGIAWGVHGSITAGTTGE
ncbi:MFS general substrate transporter [Phlebopus sp. FC_14]|nr:MFS general substrate transporter [Phlebopus sp. FC_14]